MDCDHPDPELCKRLGRHLHGRTLELYRTDPDYRRHFDNLRGLTPKGPLEKALTYGRAWVKHALGGFKELPEEAWKERLRVCSACDLYTPKGKCKACSCELSVKVRWPNEHCPLGKWHGDTPNPASEIRPTEQGGCRGCS